MPLAEKRKAVRHLLDPESPSDAAESYYAFYHAENRTQLYTFPPDSTVGVRGYVCLSRTGMDLFRPLMTMRFPEIGEAPGYDVEAAGAMIAQAIPEGSDVIIKSPASYAPLLSAFFEVNVEQRLKLL
ncbi:MAG: hypothetical protein ACK2T3_06525, partial [Candidatus Promineifilaceae bacterium]